MPKTIDLIKENRFEDLKETLMHSTAYKIHTTLLDILSNKTVEPDEKSFPPESYQEEFLEGLSIFEALSESNIDSTQLNTFSTALVRLAFQMAGSIRSMSKTASNKGDHLSDMEDPHKVNPSIRKRLQDFIEHLKNSGSQEKSIANLSAAKAQISNSVGSLLEKSEIGQDMLQFALSYENIGQQDMAIRIYQGIMHDFESGSVKAASGLFPEVSYVDDRPESEIVVFEAAKINWERLTGQKTTEPKRV